MSINSRQHLSPNQIKAAYKSLEQDKFGNHRYESKARAAELSRKASKSPCTEPKSKHELEDILYKSISKRKVDFRSHQKVDHDKKKLLWQTGNGG